MKRLAFILFILTLFSSQSYSQSCDVKIEILPEQYMYGTVSEIKDEVRKIDVEFKDDVMEVFMPLNGKNYMLKVINENCRAYCKKQKRIRQLHSGDERLVKNLINSRKEDILSQLKRCGG